MSIVDIYREDLQECYTNIMAESERTGGAKKDIVGRQYEDFRVGRITRYPHLDVATPEESKRFKRELGGKYNADQYIVRKDSRELLALEEDKGHYVDKCFAKRAVVNAMETIALCVKKGTNVPYFVLSCPTNYDMSALLSDLDGVFNEKSFKILQDKLKFFPLCEHGRTNREKYLNDNVMPFSLSDSLVEREDHFLSNLGVS
jgi:hypothetical protein